MQADPPEITDPVIDETLRRWDMLNVCCKAAGIEMTSKKPNRLRALFSGAPIDDAMGRLRKMTKKVSRDVTHCESMQHFSHFEMRTNMPELSSSTQTETAPSLRFRSDHARVTAVSTTSRPASVAPTIDVPPAYGTTYESSSTTPRTTDTEWYDDYQASSPQG